MENTGGKGIAVLSDIHGNHIALEKCLKYVENLGIDRFFFLGDYLGDFAYPEKTMDLLYGLWQEKECHFIRGNKEDYWLSHRTGGECIWTYGRSTTGMLLYSYEHLREKDFTFFEELPYVKKVKYGDMPELLLCHGSPRDVKEQMKPADEATLEAMEQCDAPFILNGHTHVQGKLCHAGKTALNPGSVGLPIGCACGAQFMILRENGNNWAEEFVTVNYDIELVIEELMKEGLFEKAPYWVRVTADGLHDGNVDHARVLKRAYKLCKAELGSCTWPDIPEKYWKQAYEEGRK